jgi:hypothetical protein
MLLKNAGALLGSNERYFTVVYEAFKYKGEDLLRTYIDFIVREPVEWIRGFPLKLRTRASFAKPKAAIIKLLKSTNVLEALGAEYCSTAHDVVWDMFKKHGDDILNARLRVAGGVTEENELIPEGEATAAATAVATAAATAVAVAPVAIDGIEEVTDISGANVAPKVVSQWETKYLLLKSVVFMLLSDYQHQQPGLTATVHTLITTLETANLP